MAIYWTSSPSGTTIECFSSPRANRRSTIEGGPTMALEIQNAPAQEAAVAPLIERTDPYMEWQKREGVPILSGVYVRNLRTAELGDWPRKGVKGAIVYLDGDDQWDSQVFEIPPGGS